MKSVLDDLLRSTKFKNLPRMSFYGIKISLHCLFWILPLPPLRIDVDYEWSLFERVNDTLGKSSPW